MIQKFQGQNVLVTTNAWFFGPDGKQYRAVWGKVSIHSDEDTLGIKTNRMSSNWYALVGDGEKAMMVAGCQIHYAILCSYKPNTNTTTETRTSDSLGTNYKAEFIPPIYLAQ